MRELLGMYAFMVKVVTQQVHLTELRLLALGEARSTFHAPSAR